MPSSTARLGNNLILASFLATLSYLPFQLVAKVTLLVSLLLFITDPYPGSRLVSLFAVGGVLLLHRAREKFMAMYGSAERMNDSVNSYGNGGQQQQQQRKENEKKSD